MGINIILKRQRMVDSVSHGFWGLVPSGMALRVGIVCRPSFWPSGFPAASLVRPYLCLRRPSFAFARAAYSRLACLIGQAPLKGQGARQGVDSHWTVPDLGGCVSPRMAYQWYRPL